MPAWTNVRSMRVLFMQVTRRVTLIIVHALTAQLLVALMMRRGVIRSATVVGAAICTASHSAMQGDMLQCDMPQIADSEAR